MSDDMRLAAVTAYLRRKKSTAEIEAIAEDCFSAVEDEVTITSHNVTDGGSSGEVTFPKWLLLKACEEILAEKAAGATGRSLFVGITRSGSRSAF